MCPHTHTQITHIHKSHTCKHTDTQHTDTQTHISVYLTSATTATQTRRLDLLDDPAPSLQTPRANGGKGKRDRVSTQGNKIISAPRK